MTVFMCECVKVYERVMMRGGKRVCVRCECVSLCEYVFVSVCASVSLGVSVGECVMGL